MKRLLILGASVLQIPAIQKAKELGLWVGVADMDPEAPGIRLADQFYEVSTKDVKGITEIARDFNPDGVMTLATDMPMRAVASVANCLGLPGITPEVALNATDKLAMIKCFERKKVPHPWFYPISERKEFEDLLKIISPPFILKPNDSSGSRGVILINNIEDAFKGFQYSKSNSMSGIVLAEEFMEGPEVSVEIITIGGKSTVLAVTDKLTTGAPYFVEMGHSQPSMLPFDTLEAIKDISIKAVQAVKIDNSPSHVEVIVTEKGPKLVELGARLGGDCITTHLVQLSTGIDMVKATILLSLGKIPPLEKKLDCGSAIRYISSREGVLKAIVGLNKVNNVKGLRHLEIVKKIGERINSVHGSNDRIGYVICQSNTPSEAIGLCEKVIKMLDVIIQ